MGTPLETVDLIVEARWIVPVEPARITLAVDPYGMGGQRDPSRLDRSDPA